MWQIFSKFKISIAAALLASSLSALAQESVGTVSFVIGESNAKQANGVAKAIKKGDQVLAGQSIETGVNGHVHLKLVDGAFVSVRPGSRFRIEEYQYDANEPKKSRIKFMLEQGTARSITGKAGEAAKEIYRLNTPLAAIGIRGTDFVVSTEADVTRVVVQSGAIVMSPLNEECSSSAYGPCKSAAARVLTAAMRDSYLELRSRKDAPILVPVEKSMSAPNLVAPPRPEEPSVDRGAKTVSAVGPSNQEVSQAVTVTTVKNQINTFATQKPAEPKPVEPAKPDPVVVIPAKIWWGRWEANSSSETPSIYSVLSPDREVTMSNVVFGMLREKGDIVDLPSAGVAKFKLADSESYLMAADRSMTVGKITDPSLTIDFGNRRFETSLTMTATGISPTEIRANGEISFQGILMAETTSPDTILAGSLSKNADQVGYLFQRNTANGMLVGATRWTK
ncbi:FecR domain-containing protein [Undibacterium cyanobacteriorum]|uniref:FecR domain-containing protein n=1 Tax=Undibacterium cyanobacteriorum TaxID=3073561 RepID=A0ABY9RIM4_9BURK|nr:FecR domain-containing protein [Undibacterium sp. 20NA77.5]WMW81078.1 FecR domain-containing protein [Undibacterium sp. 20NA77.5]